MSVIAAPATRPLDPLKFRDPLVTAKGEARASVALSALRTLWVNTGTLCNITCRNCYIESSPRNDALAYITAAELRGYLDEIARGALPVEEIGFTGGEPFLNRDLPAMLEDALSRGFRALVLTNAMKPMRNHAAALLALRAAHRRPADAPRQPRPLRRPAARPGAAGGQLRPGAWTGLEWLARKGFRVHVAGRAAFGEKARRRCGPASRRCSPSVASRSMPPIRSRSCCSRRWMPTADVPEITTACWGILKKSPDSLMCASARMVVKRRGAARPAVLACTLLPYDPQFELGHTLAEAAPAGAR